MMIAWLDGHGYRHYLPTELARNLVFDFLLKRLWIWILKNNLKTNGIILANPVVRQQPEFGSILNTTKLILSYFGL